MKIDDQVSTFKPQMKCNFWALKLNGNWPVNKKEHMKGAILMLKSKSPITIQFSL